MAGPAFGGGLIPIHGLNVVDPLDVPEVPRLQQVTTHEHHYSHTQQSRYLIPKYLGRQPLFSSQMQVCILHASKESVIEREWTKVCCPNVWLNLILG